ncbi:hypothetical protein LRS05_15345 [Flavobacterium sp. J372]|uniref:hypothetical protein n=1 Tax=Flavobacterium sp. J372 TaxID=2898436 RepID=UPI002150B029|nr:hypothetical protein [Flavobacterium sp. J372]MCR5863406.1 hypothetical protein [Flavobacterium sp. J372]
MNEQQLNSALDAILKDERLNVWHISLLAALFILAFRQDRIKHVKVSRSQLMALSHISTVPTYHKYFKELQEMGYVVYRASYHPGVRSEVDFLKQC